METEFENKDPRQIVIDEVLGQAMPLILIVYLSLNLIRSRWNILFNIFYFFRFWYCKTIPVSYFDKEHKNFWNNNGWYYGRFIYNDINLSNVLNFNEYQKASCEIN